MSGNLVMVAVEAVDFRKGIDGLARVCQEKLESDEGRGFSFVAGAVCFPAGGRDGGEELGGA
jgi:hypothetical protein